MIIKKSDRYVVTDTETKEIISEHMFEDNKNSIENAYEKAKKSNEEWKSTKRG